MNIDVDVTPLQKFMQRVAKMASLKQSDIRITIVEATEISATLSAILLNKFKSSEEKTIEKKIESRITSIDGGNFKNKT